jgi:signal transduction histidine kinase
MLVKQTSKELEEVNVLILVVNESEAFSLMELMNSVEDYNYITYHASTLKNGKQILDETKIDVVLIDLGLPDSYGAHTLTALFNEFSTTPFVILTDLKDEVIALNSVLEGAQDFLLKDQIDSLILNKSIHYAIQRKTTEKRMVATILETEDLVRKRIAIDLHDGIGQLLSSASMNLQTILPEVNLLSDERQEAFNRVVNTLQTAIAETRGMARNLMPKAVEEFGLVASVEGMIENLEHLETEIYFFNNLKGERLITNVEVMLYRIIQESVNNILKHAKAKYVSIQLIEYNDTINLMIEDDGVGFEIKSSDFKSGVGLLSIKNRVKSLGGILTIDSSGGSGTTISVEIPQNRVV